MPKKLITLFMSFAVLFLFGAGTASAAPYYHFRQYNAGSLLSDKGVNFYVNEQEVKQGRDGWCHEPGDKSRRGKFWSCTVAPNVSEIMNVPTGEVYMFRDGRNHVASRSPHYQGQYPYCLPLDYEGFLPKYKGTVWYYCSYWKLG